MCVCVSVAGREPFLNPRQSYKVKTIFALARLITNSNTFKGIAVILIYKLYISDSNRFDVKKYSLITHSSKIKSNLLRSLK